MKNLYINGKLVSQVPNNQEASDFITKYNNNNGFNRKAYGASDDNGWSECYISIDRKEAVVFYIEDIK